MNKIYKEVYTSLNVDMSAYNSIGDKINNITAKKEL